MKAATLFSACCIVVWLVIMGISARIAVEIITAENMKDAVQKAVKDGANLRESIDKREAMIADITYLRGGK